MHAFSDALSIRRTAFALALGAGALMAAGAGYAASGKGPDSVADTAERVLDAVVNISTSQTVDAGKGLQMPQVPPGSPFEEFFDEFFKRRGENGNRSRKVSSLGSGFVVDSSGIVVTNNHVIAEADEIFANFNDGSKLKAEVIGRDTKSDIAVLRVKPEKPIKAVSFGDSDKMRVGDWVMAIGNPFGLGGSVTVGVASARDRDINARPYDNILQTDAGVTDDSPAAKAGLQSGDVIVKFDGRDIKEMRDLPKSVADTGVGKTVDVVFIRKGKEQTAKVTLGRLEDAEKPQKASLTKETPPEAKPVAKSSLGLGLSGSTGELKS